MVDLTGLKYLILEAEKYRSKKKKEICLSKSRNTCMKEISMMYSSHTDRSGGSDRAKFLRV